MEQYKGNKGGEKEEKKKGEINRGTKGERVLERERYEIKGLCENDRKQKGLKRERKIGERERERERRVEREIMKIKKEGIRL